MKIACPKCGREYRLDPSRIPAKGARFTCWGCQAKVEVRPLQAGQNDASEIEETKTFKSAKAAATATGVNPPPATAAEPPASAKSEDSELLSYVTGPGIIKSDLVKQALDAKQQAAAGAPPTAPTAKEPAKGKSETGSLKAQPLKITCPKCSHEYRIDPKRIPGGGGKFTCRQCQARIEVRPNAKSDEKEPAAVPAPAAAAKVPAAPVAASPSLVTPAPPAPIVPPAPIPSAVAESKPASKIEEPAKPAAPMFSFDFTKPEEPQAEKGEPTFDGESTMVMGSPKAELAAEVIPPPPAINFDFSKPDDFGAKSAPAVPSSTINLSSSSDIAKPVEAELVDAGKSVAANPFQFSSTLEFKEPEKVKPEEKEAKIEDKISAKLDAKLDKVGARADQKSEDKKEDKKEAKPESKPTTPAFDFSFDLGGGAEKKEPPAPPAQPAPFDPFATAISGTPLPAAPPPPPTSSTFDPFATAVSAAPPPQSYQKPPASPPPFGAFDGQTTAPLPNFGAESGKAEERSADPQSGVKTLEGPAVEEKPQFTFDIEEPAKAEKKEEPKKGETNPFGLSAKPSKVGSPLDAIDAKLESKSAPKGEPITDIKTEVVRVDNDYSFKDLLPKGEEKKGEEKKEPEKKAVPVVPTPAPPPAPPVAAAMPKGVTPEIKPEPPKPQPIKPEPPRPEPPKPEQRPAALAASASARPSAPAEADLFNKQLNNEPPTPVYNPDIFAPLPEEKKAASRSRVSAIKLGAIIAVALSVPAVILIYMNMPGKTPPPKPPQVAQNNTPQPTKPTTTTPTNGTATTKPEPGKPEPGKAQPTKPEPPKPEPPKQTATKPEPPKPQPPKPEPPKPQPTKPSNPSIGALPSGTGNFTVQVSASPSQSEAEAIKKRLSSSGVDAYVVKADLGSKGIWYRVRTGRFQNSGEAQRRAAELKNKRLINDYIVAPYQQ